MRKEITKDTFPAEVLAALQQAGFECTAIGSNPERIRALKHNCAAVFERQPDGPLRLVEPPGYLIRGEIGRLWDAGYQKFWLLGPPSDEPFSEPRRPATAEQLRALRRFTEELKQVLQLPSFYNTSLGSTSEVTAYDRLKGRSPANPQRFS